MKVKFVPQNIELEVGPDKTLLQYATENGIEIKSICKGVPSCAECRIRVIDGESNVLPPNKAELELIGTNWRIDSRRLACQIRCYGDITVDMTEQIARQENQTKKVRGYRSSRHTETQAVQDTMILTEKPDLKTDSRGERTEERGASDRGAGEISQDGALTRNDSGRGGRQQQGKQQQGKQQKQQQQRQPQKQQQSQRGQQQPRQAQPQEGAGDPSQTSAQPASQPGPQPGQPPAQQQQGRGGGRNSGRQGGGRGGRGGRNQQQQQQQQQPGQAQPAKPANKTERPR